MELPLFALKDSISTSSDAAAFLRTFLPSSSEPEAEEDDEDEDVNDAEEEGWSCSCSCSCGVCCGGICCFSVGFCSAIAAAAAAVCGC